MPAGHEHRYALPPGYRLGEYRVERYLGSGGFGITYLATDENLNLRVAIKEYLPSDLALREADNSVAVKSAADRDDFEWGRKRFLDEARSLARFNHPNIVRVQRFLEAHGTSYMVMDYVEGEPLSELLKRKGKLTEAEIRRSVLPLADGLAEVHDADLLHRDIKPGNVVINGDGFPVLIDFGSARQAVGMKSRSVTSVVTPGYAPLEQYAPRSRQGPATDIYAFGAVLYRCVTGAAPDDATERAIEDRLTPAAQAAKGDYSPNLLATIDAALAVRSGDRPDSIAAFLDNLSREDTRTNSARPEKVTASSGTEVSKSSASATPIPSKQRPPYALTAFGLVIAVAGAWLTLENSTRLRTIPNSTSKDQSETLRQVENQETDQIDMSSDGGSSKVRLPDLDTEPADRKTATLREFRVLYPDYDDFTNEQVADAVYEGNPYYRQLPRYLFDSMFFEMDREPYTSLPTPEFDGEPEGSPRSNGQTSDKDDGWSLLDEQPETSPATANQLAEMIEPNFNKIPEQKFTLGSHQDDVLRLQGTPTEVSRFTFLGHEIWKYGRSTVEISTTTKRVTEWSNHSRNLKVELTPGPNVTEAQTFTLGSHQDDVLRLQGTPMDISRFTSLGYERWKYGRSTVEISTTTKRVTEWSNHSRNLKVELTPGPNVTKAQAFTLGSHQDDVLRLQGTPMDISRFTSLGYERWKYGRSTVEISTTTKRVTEWSNHSRNLKVELTPGSNVTKAQTFTLGSHQDDVLRLQGTPTEVSRFTSLGYERWKYGRSTVEISTTTKRVTEWSNHSRNLNVRLVPET